MALEKMLQMGGLGLLLAGCNELSEYDTAQLDATNYVVIDPVDPTSRDTLTCLVAGNGSVYDFFWFVNNEGVYASSGQSSDLASGYISAGDAVTCSVWTPASTYTDAFELGSETVYVH